MVLIFTLAICSKACHIRSNSKINIRDIVYANDFSVSNFYEEWFHKVVKYAYHQIGDLCYRKTNAIMAIILNSLFLLHLFEGAD